MRLQQITDAILEEAVRAQATDEFDSHDVIFWISRNRPREYVTDLHAALGDAGDPFVNLHTAVGRRLAALPNLLRQQHRKRRSMNVRGEETECEIWQRVAQQAADSLSDGLEGLRQTLIDIARRRDVIHYRPVADILGIVTDRLDHCPELNDALDNISTYEHDHGRPLLSVVVVRQDPEDQRPGAGFFKMAKRNGVQLPGQDNETFFAVELQRAYDCWQEAGNT